MKSSYIQLVKKNLLIFLLVLLIITPNTKSQINDIYPDEWLTSDSVFTQNASNNFIYQAGYFSNSSTKLYLYRQGITLQPFQYDSYCSPYISGSITINTADTTTRTSVVPSESEYYQIFQNTIYNTSNQGLLCKFPIYSSGNTAYTYTLKIPIYNPDNSSGNLEVYTYDTTTNFNQDLFAGSSPTIAAYSLYHLTLTIRQTSTTGQVTVASSATTVTTNLNASGSNFLWLSFNLQSVSINLKLTYFIITINTGGSTTNTRDGVATCNNATNPCLETYRCTGGACRRCHASCLTCSLDATNAAASTACLTCNRHTTKWIDGPSSGTCPIEYVDISQYKDITVSTIEPPRTNRVTLSFWSFITDLNSFQTSQKVVNFSVKNFLVLSLYGSSATSVGLYCTAYQKLKPNVENQTTVSGLQTQVNLATSTMINQVIPTVSQGSPSLDGRWFFSQCAMSFDHQLFYLNTSVHGIDNYSSKTLPQETLFTSPTSISNDTFFKSVYRSGEYLTLTIKNANSITSGLYIKNLYIFREFIPYELHYTHFNIHKIVSSASDWPELLYSLGFDTFSYGSTYSVTSTSYELPTAANSVTVTLTPNSTPDLYPTNNFKRLELIGTKNTGYSQSDLTATQSITATANQNINFQSNKALTCQNAKWLNLNDYSCNTDCPSGYTMYPGVSSTKGYCNYLCTASMNCPYANTQLSDLKNNFTCNGSNVSNVFYSCQSVSNPNYSHLYYNSFYTPANIYIDNTKLPSYKSYIMEIWYMQDNSMSTSNYLSTSAPSFANYIFYSNSMRVYINSSNSQYFLELQHNSGTPTNIDTNITKYEWNKLIFNVYWDTTNYNLQFYVKNKMTAITLASSSTNTNQSLQYILFCHLDVSNCSGYSVYWASGFYKGLRIWNGDVAQPYSLTQYDQYFSDTATRPQSIVFYYPLTLGYLTNNVLTDPENSSNNYTINNSWNTFNLQTYNYSSKLDYIQATGSNFTKYMSNIATNSVTLGNCNAACKRCFGTTANDCYECNTGYFLTEYTCIINSTGKYFFTSPSLELVPTDITFKVFTGITPKGTITFWAKVIGFDSTASDMIYFSPNLKLAYDGTSYGSNTNYGLNLMNSSTYLARETNFRFLFGKWTFFSLAYYYDASTISYFPSMMKFEINTTSYQILTTSINNLSISQFKICKSLYGLVANIKSYSDYIVGAFGYETNSASPSSPYYKPSPIKTYLAPGSNTSNCLSTSNDTTGWTDTYKCSVDYDAVFNSASLCSNNNYFFQLSTSACSSSTCPNKPSTSTAGCNTMCMGSSTNSAGTILTSCSCVISNSNSSMFLKNNNANVCYKYDYINFAKVNTITLSPVKTAKATEKYTLQFWIFAYNYQTNKFGGVTFKWNYHNKIDIIYQSSAYYFKCYPLYDSSDSSFENAASQTLPFNINAWNFVSCAVDRILGTYYMNTADNTFNTAYGTTAPSSLLANTVSTLIITENSTDSEWGVLFFRQIRLWIDCYTSAGFLSRVNIQTASLFPNVINLFDPVYSGTNNMIDLAGSATTVTLSYSGTIGVNVVDESVYSTLLLTSENGQYYDPTTNSSVQFVDLTRFQNIQINNIIPSHTGEYTMEFWIFTEDLTDVTNGVNIIWENHLGISVIKTTGLTSYCFPQSYQTLANITGKSGSAITALLSNDINYYANDLGSTSGQWMWVRCAVSNYNKVFYVNSSGEQELKSELLYGSTRNDIPYRYFFYNLEKSKLYIQNISTHTKKIYLRSISLFKDYLPVTYDFRYMDLTNLGQSYFPSLVFTVNFANFTFATNSLKYSLYEYGKTSSINIATTLTATSGSTFALAANFVALPLCDPNSSMKYDSATNTCVSITSCVRATLNAWYCYDENSPLTCYNNNYYNSDTTPPTCTDSCQTGVIRTPGSVTTNAICNSPCDSKINSCPNDAIGKMKDLAPNFSCQSSYDRVYYHCFPQTTRENSAIFFSRCYNMPNVYVNLSLATTNKLKNGHILEFWFKIDQVLPSCTMSTTREYYLYSPPHSIYKDTTTDKFYYNIVNSVNQGELTSIQKHEWNRIMIKTTIVSSVQTVFVYVNYSLTSAEWTMTNIPAGNNMQLDEISFCAKSTNGNCLSSGALSIEWGNAYYKNFRVWDVSASSEWLVQAYNNKLFSESLKSLILFYPMTVDKIDVNKITNTVGDYDHILYSVNYSSVLNTRLYSVDNFALINYSSVFDWGAVASNSGSYIASMTGTIVTSGSCAAACKRCYSSASTNCYECNTGFVLKGQTCINVTNYYFKIPVGVAATPVSLKITSGTNYDLTKQSSFTMTFWIKFFGVLSSAASSNPIIVSLSSNTFFSFDTSTKNLVFSQNSVTAFIDTTFTQNIGSWILVTFSNYISNAINSYYPNMLTLSVNNKDIPMQTSYSIPASGVAITQVQLGYEVVALFSDFRFYSKFIQGAYGLVTSTTITKSANLLFSISLSGNSSSNCISDTNLASGTTSALGVSCIGDYHPYLDDNIQCNDNTKFLDLSLTAVSPPCESCNSLCPTLCYKGLATQCTCDLSQGFFWLRRDAATKQAYCEPVPNIDFSSINTLTFSTIKGSKTLESTIEFWAFIYSYNSSTNQFKQIDIEWDLHNKVSLYNQNNSLYSKCYSVYDINTPSRYTENLTLTLTYYKWNLIRCGTDLKNKQFFFNSVLTKMETTDIPTQPTNVSFKISMPATAGTNFGFVFLREIKLWQQFNFKYIDTSYIQLTYTNYPGLLHYFKNTYDSTIVAMTDTVVATVTQPIIRRLDFLGYNFVDSSNTGLYSNLNLCQEGKVYNPTILTCTTPSSTKCEYPGDVNDNCILCPTANKFINTDDGTCIATCKPKSFGNTNINQCRECHSTCYQCSDIWDYSCTACTGDLYFVQSISKCVSNCEEYKLTKSLTTPNLCVVFDASAELVNVSVEVPINPTTFNTLTGRVIGATAPGYTTLWEFNQTATIAANTNSTNPVLNLKATGPFVSDRNNLTVSLDPDYFQLGFKYNFILNIIKSNLANSVTVTKNWTLTMNQQPKSGTVKVTPVMGLRNTTVFIIECPNWVDDNSKTLTYRFISIENNTNTQNIIKNWTESKETYTAFNVRFYQLPSTSITVYCEVMDSMGAVNSTSTDITIVNSLSSGIYNLTTALKDYTLSSNLDDLSLYARSEYLRSLGIDTIKEVKPKLLKSVFTPSLDNSIITLEDPKCTSNFCNGNGYCDLVDKSLSCICDLGYLGSNCHIDKNGYSRLESEYLNLYNSVNLNIGSQLTLYQLMSMRNLFNAASTFINAPSFFTTDLNTFLTLAENSFMDSILENPSMFFDLYDYYYTYQDIRLNQVLLKNKNSTNYPYRNVTLTVSQQTEFANTFGDIRKGLKGLIENMIKKLGTSSRTIQYDSSNFYIAVGQLTPVFNETKFFESRISQYKSWVQFMKCINYIQITRLNNPYYIAWFAFVEYQNFPFSYNSQIYTNNTSPLVELYFIDAQTGKSIIVEGCDSTNPISFYLPFTSYTWMSQLNAQKWLYNPDNYKSPDDPIFSSPIYINETGFVSNDTIEERIILYHRKYNFSCEYYEEDSMKFAKDGLNFTNLTSNYIQFNTSHLTPFSTFFIQNDVTYNVDGRFFYIKHPSILLYAPNYWTNYAWFVIFALLVFYFFVIFIQTCYDYKFFRQESLLDFLKKEIVKVHSPYEQHVEFIDNEEINFNNDFVPSDNRPYDDFVKRKGNNYNAAREELDIIPNFDSKDNNEILNLNEEFRNHNEMANLNIDSGEKENNFKPNFRRKSQFGVDSIDIRDDFKNKVSENKDDTFNFGNEKGMNNFLNYDDKKSNEDDRKFAGYLGDVNNVKFTNNNETAADPINDEENEEEAYEKRLEAFSNLNLSVCQFLCWNLKQRHVLIAPLINVSVFNPRYKKLTLFVTECSLIMLVLAVQMTDDPTTKIDFTTTPVTMDNLGNFIKFCFISVFASNFMIYILAVFFRASLDQRKRLYKIVTSGAQLLILKEWEEMACTNLFYTILGMLLNISLWLVSFYFSITFVAVWKAYAWTWLLGFLISFGIDIILFEFMFEWFISWFYWRRRTSQFALKFCEWLNRVRSYRTLWP